MKARGADRVSIDAFFQSVNQPLGTLARRLRRVILAALPDVSESIKWGMPVYEGRGLICAIRPGRTYVALQFYASGTSLRDPAGLLEGTGQKMRHVKIRSTSDIRSRLFTSWLRQAAAQHTTARGSRLTKSGKKSSDLHAVVAALRRMIAPFEASLVLASSSPAGFSFNTGTPGPSKAPLFFAGAQVRKGYVSFYLFPVYMYPDLLGGMSPGLKKRMQGKSCFNFRNVDPILFQELAKLTSAGYKRLAREGLLRG